MNTKLLPLLSISGLLLFANHGTAQNRRAEFGMSFEAGPAGLEFGGSVAAAHWARKDLLDSNGSYEVQVGASLIERTKVWGVGREAKAYVATYTARQIRTGSGHAMSIVNSKTGSLVVRLAGITVYSSTSNSTQTHSQIIAPGELYGSSGLQHSVFVYGYGVAVKVKAQAGANFSLTPTLTVGGLLVNAVSVALTGTARGDVTGSASSYLAVPGVTTGVSGSLQFASARFDLSASASPFAQSGSLAYVLKAITLQLSAYLTIYPPLLAPVTFSSPIVNYTAAQTSGTIPLL